jgi:hypothetical protein
MGIPVAELLTRIPSKEMTEWIAFWALRAEEREKAARQRR